MGKLILPASGPVCVDTQVLIYTVEQHPTYGPVLDPLWNAARKQGLTVVASELVLLETLVLPLKSGNTALQADYQHALFETELVLSPITQGILMRAAGLRASLASLRTPDAIHAATALDSECTMFLTNDRRLARVPGLTIVVLDDALGLTHPA